MAINQDTFSNMFGSKPSQRKAEEVAKAKLKKQATFTNDQLAGSLAEFVNANPTSSALDQRLFLNQQRQYQNQFNQSTLEDIGTDLSIAFGDRLPQTAYGAVGLLGDAMGAESISDWGFEGAAEQQAQMTESEGEYSLDLQKAKANILAAAEARKEQYMEDGEITSGESLDEFGRAVLDYVNNPLAALSGAVQNSTDLIAMGTGGGAVGTAAKILAKKQLKKKLGDKATKEVLDKAGQKAATTAGAIAGDVYTAASEGVNNALQVRDEVLALDQETLSGSEEFNTLSNEMLKDNPDVTFEEVRKQFATNLAQNTALKTGATAAVIGRASQVTDKFSNVLNRPKTPVKGVKANAKQTAKDLLEGAGKEGVEETLQSGSGQLLSNIEVQKADAEKQTLEGVGEAAGAGTATGALSGGVMSGAGSATKTAASATGEVLKATGKAVGKVVTKPFARKEQRTAEVAEVTQLREDTAKGTATPTQQQKAQTTKDKYWSKSTEDFAKEFKGDPNKVIELTTGLTASGIAFSEKDIEKVEAVLEIVHAEAVEYAEKQGETIREQGAKDLDAEKASTLAAGTVASTNISDKDAKANLDLASDAIGTNAPKDADSGLEGDSRVLASSPEAMAKASASNQNLLNSKAALGGTLQKYGSGTGTMEEINNEVHGRVVAYMRLAVDSLISGDVKSLNNIIQDVNTELTHKNDRLRTPPANGKQHKPKFKDTLKAEMNYLNSLKDYIVDNGKLSSNPELHNIDPTQTYSTKPNPVTGSSTPKTQSLAEGSTYTSLTPKGNVQMLSAINAPETNLKGAIAKDNLELSDATVSTLENIGSADKALRPTTKQINEAISDFEGALGKANLKDDSGKIIRTVPQYMAKHNPESLNRIADTEVKSAMEPEDVQTVLSQGVQNTHEFVAVPEKVLADGDGQTGGSIRKEINKLLTAVNLADTSNLKPDVAARLVTATALANKITALPKREDAAKTYNQLVAAINEAKIPTKPTKKGVKPLTARKDLNIVKAGVFDQMTDAVKSLFNIKDKSTIAASIPNLFGGFLTEGNTDFDLATVGLDEPQKAQLRKVMLMLKSSVTHQIKAYKKDFKNKLKEITFNEQGIPNDIIGAMLYTTDSKGNLVPNSENNIEDFINQFSIALLGALSTNPFKGDLETTLKQAGAGNLKNESGTSLQAHFTPALIRQLGKGQLTKFVHEDLGKAIASSMGISVSKTEDIKLPAFSTDSLGSLGVAMLEDIGAITTERIEITVTKDEDGNFKNSKYVKDSNNPKHKPNRTPILLRVNTDAESLTSLISEANLNAFFQDFVNTERNTRTILTEPNTVIKNRMTEEGELATDHATALDNAANVPRTVFKGLTKAIVDVYDNNLTFFQKMMGVDLDSVLPMEAEGVAAKLEGLDDTINELKKVLSDPDAYEQIYQSHVLGKNVRDTEVSTLSPQADKLVRALVNAHQNDQVDSTKPDEVTYFKVAVAKAFDKGEGNKAESAKWFEDTFGNITEDTNLDALNSNAQIALDTYNAIEARTRVDSITGLAELIDSGKLHAETLQGIYGVGAYINSLQTGNPDKFTHHMFREDDGLANGIYYLITQFGAFNNVADLEESMKQVGVSIGDIPDVVDLRGKEGFTDVYQTLAKSVVGDVSKLKTSLDNTISALSESVAQGKKKTDYATKVEKFALVMDNVFDAKKLQSTIRNIMKYPLMTYIYGAGDTSILELMNADFTDLMLKRVRELQKELIEEYPTASKDFLGSKDTQARLEAVTRELEGLASIQSVDAEGKITFKKFSPRFKLEPEFNTNTGKIMLNLYRVTGKGKDTKEILVSDPSTLSTLFAAGIKAIVGDSTLAAIDARYGKVGEVANLFSTSVQLISEMYVADYNAMVKNLNVGTGKLTIAQHEEILADLNKMYPAIATALSETKEGRVLSGLNIHKQELKSKPRDEASKHSIKVPSQSVKSGVKTSTSSAPVHMEAVSSVSNPYIGHSLDATVIAQVLLKNPKILQVYDGLVQPVNSTEATATANEAAKDTLDYSPLEAVQAAITRAQSLRNANKLQEYTTPITTKIQGKTVQLTPIQLTKLLGVLHSATNLYKAELLKVVSTVNQYMNIDGGYPVGTVNNSTEAKQSAVVASQLTHRILKNVVDNAAAGTNMDSVIDSLVQQDINDIHQRMYKAKVRAAINESAQGKYPILDPNSLNPIKHVVDTSGSPFVFAAPIDLRITPNPILVVNSTEQIKSKSFIKHLLKSANFKNLPQVMPNYIVDGLNNLVQEQLVRPLVTGKGAEAFTAMVQEEIGKTSFDYADLFGLALTHPVYRKGVLEVLNSGNRAKKATLGSTAQASSEIDNITIEAVATVDSMDISQLTDSLHARDPNKHFISTEHSSVLSDLINKVSNVYKTTKTAVSVAYGVRNKGGNSIGTVDLGSNKITVGLAKTSSPAGTTAKEVLAHELVHPIWAWGIRNGFAKELNGIVLDFIKGIGGKQGLVDELLKGIPSPTKADITKAKELAEYTLGNHENALDEFAAYAMTNEKFIKLLSKLKRSYPEPVNTFGGKLRKLYDQLINLITGKAYDAGNQGNPLDKSMVHLFNDIEQAYRASRSTAVAETRKSLLVDKAGKGVDMVFDKTDALLKKTVLGVVAVIGGSHPALGTELVDKLNSADPEKMVELNKILRENLNEISKALPQEIQDNITQLIGEKSSVARANQGISRATAMVDTTSNKLKTSMYQFLGSLVPEQFKFDDTRATAIRNGYLKADLHALIKNGFNKNMIKDMYADPKEVTRVMTQLGNEVSTLYGNQNVARVAVRVAKAFGGFQVNGKSKYGTYLQNPQIAAATITAEFKLDPTKEEAFADILDQMMSVGTIQETHVTKDNAVIVRELNNPEMDNYYAHLDKAMQGLHERSKDVFENSEKIMVKGYIQDVTNPNISMITEGLHKQKEMEKLGYTLQEVHTTANNEKVGIFTRAYGGSVYTATSSFKRVSNEAAGTGLADTLAMTVAGMNSQGYLGAIQANEQLRASLSAELRAYAQNKTIPNLMTVKYNMVPLPSKNGTVYRFRSRIVSEEFKAKNLGLYNDPSAALANSMGVIQYKVAAPESNAEVVADLKKMYVEEYHKYPNSFVEINPRDLKSTKNKRFVRAYLAMDAKSQNTLRDAFGGGTIYVKRNQYTQLFGYDRFSVRDIQKNTIPEVRAIKELQRLANNVMVPFINNRIVQALEYGQQEYVKEILKAIVVKTGTVTIGNMAGNLGLSFMLGMTNPAKTVKDVAEGIQYGKEFIEDLDKKTHLEAELIATPIENTKKRELLKKRISLLESNLRRSPMYDLYKDGHINHVVTDPANDITQIGTPKSKVREFANSNFFAKAHPALGEFAKELVATEDSLTYSFMQQSVLMSDLGFKYAYYKHQQSRNVPKTEALDNISYIFLNYDTPSSKGVDYLESLGFAMFIKFKMRFSRALWSQFANSPSRAMAVSSVMDMVIPTQNITEAGLISPDGVNNILSNPYSNMLTPITEMPVASLVGIFSGD